MNRYVIEFILFFQFLVALPIVNNLSAMEIEPRVKKTTPTPIKISETLTESDRVTEEIDPKVSFLLFGEKNGKLSRLRVSSESAQKTNAIYFINNLPPTFVVPKIDLQNKAVEIENFESKFEPLIKFVKFLKEKSIFYQTYRYIGQVSSGKSGKRIIAKRAREEANQTREPKIHNRLTAALRESADQEKDVRDSVIVYNIHRDQLNLMEYNMVSLFESLGRGGLNSNNIPGHLIMPKAFYKKPEPLKDQASEFFSLSPRSKGLQGVIYVFHTLQGEEIPLFPKKDFCGKKVNLEELEQIFDPILKVSQKINEDSKGKEEKDFYQPIFYVGIVREREVDFRFQEHKRNFLGKDLRVYQLMQDLLDRGKKVQMSVLAFNVDSTQIDEIESYLIKMMKGNSVFGGNGNSGVRMNTMN